MLAEFLEKSRIDRDPTSSGFAELRLSPGIATSEDERALFLRDSALRAPCPADRSVEQAVELAPKGHDRALRAPRHCEATALHRHREPRTHLHDAGLRPHDLLADVEQDEAGVRPVGQPMFGVTDDLEGEVPVRPAMEKLGRTTVRQRRENEHRWHVPYVWGCGGAGKRGRFRDHPLKFRSLLLALCGFCH